MNQNIPELYLELCVKLKSKVPVIAKMCPSETVKIWKKKNCLRIDWTIAKIVGFKIARAQMSIIGRIENDGTVNIVAINRDEKTVETLHPNASKSIMHDITDAFMRDGISCDEMPIEEFKFTRATNKAKREKRHYIKSGGYDTQVFELSGLSWRQHCRVPIVERTLFDQCTDECRNVPIRQNIENIKKVTDERKQKIESLSALQFISESDLAADYGQPEYAEASDIFLNAEAEEITDDSIKKVDSTINSYMSQISQKASKHMRSLTRNTTIVRSRSKTSTPKSARDTIDEISRKYNKMTLGELDYVRMHPRSYPTPVPPVSMEEYMAGSSSRMHAGRACHSSTSTFVRNTPIQVFMCKEFPISVHDVLPLLDWATRKVAQPGALKKFFDEHGKHGFPVRVQIPIVAMLSAKVTVASVAKRCDQPASFFDIPSGLKTGEIFPLIEIE